MQKERELKRKQAQSKKEAEAQARLVVLKVNNNLLFPIYSLFIFIGRT